VSNLRESYDPGAEERLVRPPRAEQSKGRQNGCKMNILNLKKKNCFSALSKFQIVWPNEKKFSK